MSGLYLMLTPKSLSMDDGGVGKSDLQPMDIAAAISWLRLSEFETCYIRARVLDAEDWGPGTALELMGWIYAVAIANENGWTVPRGSELIRKAMFQVMDERIRAKVEKCGACRGTGTVARSGDGLRVPCRACDRQVDDGGGHTIGNGRRRVSNREYARRLGVAKDTFKNTWLPRMEVLKRSLLRIEQKARYLPGVVYED